MESFNKPTLKSLNTTIHAQVNANETTLFSLYDRPNLSKNSLGILFFIGADNVGKNLLAHEIAIQDARIEHYKLFDMAHYDSEESSNDLYSITLDEEGNSLPFGSLYSQLIAYPKSLIVFDKIDEAHIKVQSFISQMLNDPVSFNLDFKDTLIIFTTSQGQKLYAQKEFLSLVQSKPLHARAIMIEHLSSLMFSTNEPFFNEHFLELIKNEPIITFESLTYKSISEIAIQLLYKNNTLLNETFSNKISFDEEVITLLTLSFIPYVNAKEIKRLIEESLFFRVNQLIKNSNYHDQVIHITLSSEAKSFLNEHDSLLHSFYQNGANSFKQINLEWEININESKAILNIKKVSEDESNKSLFGLQTGLSLQISKISFKDIAGQENVKKSLSEIIHLLGKTDALQAFDINKPRGLVLFGPEGVGKTKLAQAFCQEADLPYIILKTIELFDPQKVANAYQIASQNQPSILILEGLDAQGYVEGMVTKIPAHPFVSAIDHYGDRVFTIATVQNLDELDNDYLSSGRIDLRVEVPELDKGARRFYIEKLLKKPSDTSIDIDKVVRYVNGMNHDELERLIREVSIHAIKKNSEVIKEEMIIEEINIIKYGQKLDSKRMKNFDEELKMTAYHEAGHAVLSFLLLPDVKIEQVTITPRAGALGFVSYNTDEIETSTTKDDLFNNVCVLLAGRLVQIKAFGESRGLDSGAMSDLEQATAQVYIAIAMLGMDEELGMISLGALDEKTDLFRDKIEERISDWFTRAKTKTEILIDEHWSSIETLSKKLISEEVVEGEMLSNIISKENTKR
jgi:cell division protease FtsH